MPGAAGLIAAYTGVVRKVVRLFGGCPGTGSVNCLVQRELQIQRVDGIEDAVPRSEAWEAQSGVM